MRFQMYSVYMKIRSRFPYFKQVIQRRFNGSISFYRNFSDYEHGFGDLSGEFWMGKIAARFSTNFM